jgi:amino acid transporter
MDDTQFETKDASLEGTMSEESKLSALGYKQELKRTMSLADVVIFGLIFMAPFGPTGVFGAVFNASHGMVALVYLVAGIAMFFSALSYKEMAKEYPVAGSVYSYVRLGTNRFVGFLAGWAILLDYLLLPGLMCIFGASAMATFFPTVPGWVWVAMLVVLVAVINLRGLVLTARMNVIFLVIQLVTLAVFMFGALVAISQGHAKFTLDPLFQPEFFSWGLVFSAIPLAALSYIGFDAVSTLNEEAKGGGKAVSKATMIVLFLIVFIFIAQVYLAALFVPTNKPFAEGDAMNNAFYYITAAAVAPWFQVVFTLVAAIVAIFSNLMVTHATVSKLIFAMARDRQLPHRLAYVSPKRKVPAVAMISVSIITMIFGVAVVGQIELVSTMVTFGALTAYILLHISVIIQFGIRRSSKHFFLHWVSPIIGAAVLLYALYSTNDLAKVIGISWMIVGCVVAFVLARMGRTLETESV